MENNIKRTLHHIAANVEPPEQLKDEILNKVGKQKRLNKSKLLLTIAAIVITIPLSAFTSKYFFADMIYGSYSSVNSQLSESNYTRIDNKLIYASKQLNAKEFAFFLYQAKEIIQVKLKYGDKKGSIEYSSLPEEVAQHYFTVIASVQPYFDRLNGYLPSNEVLSHEEYEQYIHALIQLETITTLSNKDRDEYSYAYKKPELIEAYEEASEIVRQVELKISR